MGSYGIASNSASAVAAVSAAAVDPIPLEFALVVTLGHLQIRAVRCRYRSNREAAIEPAVGRASPAHGRHVRRTRHPATSDFP